MPGGCRLENVRIDLHLKGFQALGAKIIQKNGYIEAIADQLIGNTIYFRFSKCWCDTKHHDGCRQSKRHDDH